jgi:diguanylate cyclase (GGDEF)-like protein
MGFSIQKRITMVFGLGLVLLSLSSGFSYWSITRFIHTSNRVIHTQKILKDLAEIWSGIKDAEANERGYIMTGKNAYLASHQAAGSRVKTLLRNLHKLTVNQPEQYDRLDRLAPLIDQKFGQIKSHALNSSPLSLHQANRFDPNHQELTHSQDKRLIDQIQRLLQEIERQENNQLEWQLRAAEKNAWVATAIISVSCLLAIVIAPSAILVINRYITRRRQAEAALQASEVALQQANQQLLNWVEDLEKRNQEIILLSEMNDLFQVCMTLEEACTVVAQIMPVFFPKQSGSIYLMNDSRNLLEALASWGDLSINKSTFTPTHCLSLRQGQEHLAKPSHRGLQCNHCQYLSQAEHFCIPMLAQGETMGMLHLSSAQEKILTESKQQLAKTIAKQVALSLANLKLRETLRHQSVRDPLTGLFNRRYLEESLSREVQRAQRNQHALSVIMVDVDHFKRFNDTFGHEAGDMVLRELGRFLRKHTRESDIACRYGGEEMALILPDASLPDAQQRAEDLRLGVKQLNVSLRHQLLGTITISLGVASFPVHGSSGEEVIQEADLALYQAKRQGRDRVIVAASAISCKPISTALKQ